MKKILVFVSTVDGKITKWGNPNVHIWSSKNDQRYFSKIFGEASVVIMGSTTYNAEPIKPSPGHLKVIMTSQPSRYKPKEVPGQIEFTAETPSQLIDRFEKQGHNQILIVGGPHVATSFLQELLIDELWLTLEPKIFGIGGGFVIEEKLDISLQLLSLEKLNEQGTLILKYEVKKEQKN